MKRRATKGALATGGLKALCLCASVLNLFSGCQSYTINQRLIFADDDGNVVIVDYGRSESEHYNTFISPANGKEMEFHSKHMVKVQLPDGDDFKAWECMSFLPPATGTMYKTDNEEWKVLANGFSFSIYHRTGEPPPRDYLEVYRGVVCDIPDRKIEKNDKWRDVTNAGKGRVYEKPVEKVTK